MPSYSFVEVRQWVQETAKTHDIVVSSRKAKAIAGHWLSDQALYEDGELESTGLHYQDPTGDAAVANLLKLLREQH